MINRRTPPIMSILLLGSLLIMFLTSEIRIVSAQNEPSPPSPEMAKEIKRLYTNLDNWQNPPKSRLDAIIRLDSYGPDAMSAKDYLKKALDPKYAHDPLIQMIAAFALRDFGGKAADSDIVNALIDRLKDDDDDYVKANAADALGLMGSKEAVDSLIPLLTSSNPHVKGTAAWALYGIWSAEGVGGTDIPHAVSTLRSLLKDRSDISIRTNAAAALGAVAGALPPEEKAKSFWQTDNRSITDDLVSLLRDPDPRVQEWVVFALGRIGSEDAKKKSSSTLIQLLNYPAEDQQRRDVCLKASEAVAELGIEEAIHPLIRLLNDPNEEVRKAAADALDALSSNLHQAKVTNAIGPLTEALKALKNARDVDNQNKPDSAVTIHAFRVQESIDGLKSLQWKQLIHQNRFVVLAVVIISGLLLVCLGLLWIYPLALLRINDALSNYLDVKLPAWLGGVTIPLRYVLLVGFFHYHHRVLDAWVAQHLDTARKRFFEKPTIQERETHIPVPVVLNKKSVPSLSAAELRPAFSENICYFLIFGEGGSGKTSLACRLAKWAMSSRADERFHKDYPILPVFIEPEIEAPANDEDFLRLINDQLRGLTDRIGNVPEDLLRNLLKRGRVMLVIDGFSEMTQATRKAYVKGVLSAPANAVIFTSRANESLGGLPKNTIEPLRINGKQLSSFMEAYLINRGKRSLFDDPEFFDYCKRLSSIVADRDITALLAKYYVEQMIAAKEGTIGSDLPNNIPDLMVTYIGILYRQPPEAPDIREVIRGAEVVAWECLKKTYTPMPGNREEVLAALGGPEKGRPIVDYLEDTLKITKTVGALRNQVRFVFDPLSEYLASLHLLENYRNNEGMWRAFLSDADKKEGGPNSIRSFLLAMRDCCVSKGADYDVPAFMADELGRRAGL
jgi:HEAT repeat protein